MATPATQLTALNVLRRLRDAGYQAMFAGGCVRDMLLNRPWFDYDIATDASPYQVKQLFRHVLLVGAKFGVAMVIEQGKKVEVTTFRSDLSYTDGRRPDGVTFATPREDALRRDFTINGMFYDPLREQVIDYVGGQEDLRAGVIRTIGSPQQRFDEDYLRMLRAVRFAVRLEFQIDPATAAAIVDHAPKIISISGERIFDELSKMLSLPSAPQAMELLHQLNLLQQILPELMWRDDSWMPALARVRAVARKQDFVLTLGALMAKIPAASIPLVLRRWGASNSLCDATTWISQHFGDWPTAADLPLAEFKRLMAKRHFSQLRHLWAVEERRKTGWLDQTRRIAVRVKSIPRGKVSPKPLLSGKDLLAMGLPEGERLGGIFKAVYDAQLNEEISTAQQAVELANRLIGSA